MTATNASPTLEQIADELEEAQQQIRAWEDRRKATIEALEALHAAGQAPEKFSRAGVTFTRQAGRITYDFGQCPDVIGQKQQLKDAEEVAKALGLATPKEGAATWRVTSARS